MVFFVHMGRGIALVLAFSRESDFARQFWI